MQLKFENQKKTFFGFKDDSNNAESFLTKAVPSVCDGSGGRAIQNLSNSAQDLGSNLGRGKVLVSTEHHSPMHPLQHSWIPSNYCRQYSQGIIHWYILSRYNPQPLPLLFSMAHCYQVKKTCPINKTRANSNCIESPVFSCRHYQ